MSDHPSSSASGRPWLLLGGVGVLALAGIAAVVAGGGPSEPAAVEAPAEPAAAEPAAAEAAPSAPSQRAESAPAPADARPLAVPAGEPAGPDGDAEPDAEPDAAEAEVAGAPIVVSGSGLVVTHTPPSADAGSTVFLGATVSGVGQASGKLVAQGGGAMEELPLEQQDGALGASIELSGPFAREVRYWFEIEPGNGQPVVQHGTPAEPHLLQAR